MPLDTFTGTLITPQRDDSREFYLRSYRLRNPAALTTENTQPWIDASCIADTLQVVHRDAIVINNGITLSGAQGPAVDQRLADLGLSRQPAIGASGYVVISASAGGTALQAGDILKHEPSGLQFQCNQTGLYLDGASVPVVGVDVGYQTNLNGGTVLKWSSPRPGCGTYATVAAQADGVSGLTGGKPIEDDNTAITRAKQVKANPPASGNDAQYQTTGLATAGVAVQQIFTYPAILGSSAIGFVFTLRPAGPGQTRIPNGAQIAAVLGYLTGAMPADDNIFACSLTAQPTDVVLKLTWASGAATWVDTSPWPQYFPIAAQAITVASATDATHFVLQCANGSYTSVNQPAAGQTFAVYDKAGQVFRRKKILSVTGTGPWAIICDTSNAASDTSYKPVVNQRACPWSDSLNAVPAAVIGYFDGLGPGEQVASFFDPGLRQKRSPAAPALYPSAISNRITNPVQALTTSVQDVVLTEPTPPFAATVGTPGVMSYLITLGFLSIFPQP